MSKLNARNTAVKAGLKKVNYEGNLQDVKRVEQQLYEIVVMTLYGKDSFYESSDERVTRLRDLVNKVVAKGNLDFVANAIVHARTEMKMRSMPIILTVLFAEALRSCDKHYDHLRRVVCDVIQRADQITDLYAFALAVFGEKGKIPMAVRRGVADAFNKFNEYQLAKYNRSDSVKLKDVLRIVHPKAKDETQGQIFERLVKDELQVPYTWEVELSQNGQLPVEERKSQKQLWSELIESGKLGYMAIVRNLRNIVQADVDADVIRMVANRIADPNQVAKSGMFPFQFVTAYDVIKDAGNHVLLAALTRAIDASLGNLPQLGKRVWIIVDCSLSMNHGAKTGSPIRTAALFAAAIAKANASADNVRLTMFSDYAKMVAVDTENPVMTIANKILKGVFGGGTRLDLALDTKDKLGFEPDTVILLSDMQVFNLHGLDISSLFSKDCVKVAINLEAYETTPAYDHPNGWLQLAGWSESLFKFIPALRNGSSITKMLSVPYMGVDAVKQLAVKPESIGFGRNLGFAEDFGATDFTYNGR